MNHFKMLAIIAIFAAAPAMASTAEDHGKEHKSEEHKSKEHHKKGHGHHGKEHHGDKHTEADAAKPADDHAREAADKK